MTFEFLAGSWNALPFLPRFHSFPLPFAFLISFVPMETGRPRLDRLKPGCRLSDGIWARRNCYFRRLRTGDRSWKFEKFSKISGVQYRTEILRDFGVLCSEDSVAVSQSETYSG